VADGNSVSKVSGATTWGDYAFSDYDMTSASGIYGVKWRCGDGTSSESFGYKMVGLSRTGATGASYEQITYGMYCRNSRTDNAIMNYGTESSYDLAGDDGVARIDVSKFLDGTGYTKDDVFSMEFVGTVLHWKVNGQTIKTEASVPSSHWPFRFGASIYSTQSPAVLGVEWLRAE